MTFLLTPNDNDDYTLALDGKTIGEPAALGETLIARVGDVIYIAWMTVNPEDDSTVMAKPTVEVVDMAKREVESFDVEVVDGDDEDEDEDEDEDGDEDIWQEVGPSRDDDDGQKLATIATTRNGKLKPTPPIPPAA